MVAQGSRWLCSGHTFADCHELEASMVMIMNILGPVVMMFSTTRTTRIRASTRFRQSAPCTIAVIRCADNAGKARKAEDPKISTGHPDTEASGSSKQEHAPSSLPTRDSLNLASYRLVN